MTVPITKILIPELQNESEEDKNEETMEKMESENNEEEEKEQVVFVEYVAPDEEETFSRPFAPPVAPSVAPSVAGDALAKTQPPPTTGPSTGTITKLAFGRNSSAAPKRNVAIRLRHIPSIPNFRALLWDRQRNPVIFRSARQECIALEDIKPFMDFDIKTIIDLRSCHEYASTSGDRLLDRIYPVFEVALPKEGSKFDAKEAKCTQVSYNYPKEDNAISQQFLRPEEVWEKKRRLLIPICNKYYLLRLAKEIGGYHLTAVRAVADLATFFKFGFLTRRFVEHFNGLGQWGLYVSYLEHGANAIVAALKIINEPQNLPVLINCHVGKDRTGVLAAILLTIVGVSREDILKDYARSEEGIQLVRDDIREYMLSQRMYWDEEFLHAFPDDLQRVFEFVDDKYGSLNNFLHVNGFTLEEQARLKENLLVGSRSSIAGDSATTV